VSWRTALVALAPVAALTACGEKEETVSGPSRAEIAALLGSGLRAVGSDPAAAGIRFSADGQVLRIRLASAPAGGPLHPLLASLDRVSASIDQFCPKPALLRCRPSFRAWASPRSGQAVRTSLAALRRLAAQTYDGRLLVRRRGLVTRIITANGELLAAVRTMDAGVTFSFGGLDPPRRPPRHPAAGGLELEADAAALETMLPALPPPARRALAGVRRLNVSAPLEAANP
jgi:hypothetical protein